MSWQCVKCGESYEDAYPITSHLRVCGTLAAMGRKDVHETIEVYIRPRDDHRFELVSPYNSSMPRMARAIGGRWSGKDKVWVFANAREPEVRELCREIYGIEPKATFATKHVCPHTVINQDTGVCAACGEICDYVEPPRKVRGIIGLKAGDKVNVTLKDGKIRELLVEKGAKWALDKDIGIPYAELELRTFAAMVAPPMFTEDGLLNYDAVAERRPDGKWHYGRSFIVASVNERLAALDKRVKMLEAERGPGIKYDPVVIHCDNGED